MGSNPQEVLASAKQMIAERRYQDAVRACRRHLLSTPGASDVRLLLGHALMALGRYEDVRAEMQTLLQSVPELGEAHRVLGEAWLRLDDKEQAAGCLRTALHLDVMDGEARQLLSELEGGMPGAVSADRRFTDETTTADLASVMRADPSLPSMNQPEFDDPTNTSSYQIAVPPQSVQIAPDFLQEAEELAELEGESTVMTSEHFLGDDTTAAEPVAAHFAQPAPAHSAPAQSAPVQSAPVQSAPPAPVAPLPAPPEALPPAPTAKRKPKPTMMGMGMGAAAPPPMRTPEPSAAELSLVDLLSSSIDLNTGDLGVADAMDAEPTVPRPRKPAPSKPGPFDDEETRALTPAENPGHRQLPPVGGALLGSAHAPPPSVPPPPSMAPPRAAPPRVEHRQPTIPPPISSPGAHPSPFGPPGGSSNQLPPGYPGPAPTAAPPLSSPPRAGPPESPRTLPPPSFGAPVAVGLGSGQAGLPPLDNEATRARESVDPFGQIAPTATPMHHALAHAPQPSDVTPPMETRPRPEKKKRGERGRPTLVLDNVKRRWPPAVLVALLGIPVLLLAVSVFAYRRYAAASDEAEVATTSRRAANEGTLVLLREAIALDAEVGSEEPNAIARRAFLYALATVEHGTDESARVEQLAGQVPDLLLARLARAYLLLDTGQTAEAGEALSSIPDEEAQGEVVYARAVIALRRGDVEQALSMARAAQSFQPTSTRYTAFMVQAQIRAGRIEDASALATGLESTTGPVAGLARSEAKLASGETAVARTLAEAVIADETASDRQKRHAQLILGRVALQEGDDDAAAASVAQAVGEGSDPIGDESFVLMALDTLVSANKRDAAVALLARLPAPVSDASRRAEVSAATYLLAGDIARAEQALASAPDSPRVAFMRGRVAEAKGDLESAKRAYEAAAASPDQAFVARLRLGAIALSEGDRTAGIEGLKAILPDHDGHPELVSLLVGALIREGETDEASRVVATARRVNPADARVQAAEANVQLAKGEFEAALASLEALVRAQPNDPLLQASLGDAALQANNRERALTAFDRALALDSRNERALLGKIALAKAAGDVAALESAIAAAETGGIPATRLARFQAELSLFRAEGVVAVAKFEALVTRSTTDADLLAGLGWAHAQAESYRTAIGVFDRALRADRRHIAALVGKAFCETRGGRLRAAGRLVSRARGYAETPGEEARVDVASGWVDLEFGRMSDAREAADRAIEKDDRLAEAYFLRAMVATVRDRDSVADFRRALGARQPSPEVIGQLVVHDGRASDACDLARRYMAAAPEGIDARDVQRRLSSCR